MSNTADLTAATITDLQIAFLAKEAAEHGDRIQVAYCDVALHGVERAGHWSRSNARAKCAEAINAARAMEARVGRADPLG